MKPSTMCLMSGVAGALFAVACGAVDGLSNDANATSVALVKETKTFTCVDDGSGTIPTPEPAFDEWMAEAQNNGWLVSSFGAFICFDYASNEYIEGEVQVAYIR